MKKGIALIVMLLAAVVMLSGCNLIGYDAELDGAQVVAKINDTEVTKASWAAYRDYLLAYEQQYMLQNYGISLPVDETTIETYGEYALEQLIQSTVVEGKLKELGLDVLSEEEDAEVQAYADSMVELYEMLIRFQNYGGIETVEEEQERLAAEAAEATASEPAEPVATVTNAELDAMIQSDLAAYGYTREYFVENETATRLTAKLQEHVYGDLAVTDEQVQAEFDSRVASQKETYDATPTAYAAAEQNGMDLYYVPEGYRGVKNLLIMFSDEKQAELQTLNSELSVAQSQFDNGSEEIEKLAALDTAQFDEETKAEYDAQMTELEEQVATAQATVEQTQAKIEETTEAAYAEILPMIEGALSRAQAGDDFDVLLAVYGEDTGMTTEPNLSRGYLVCEGLNIYEQAFQDAAMALENVGDVSAEPVKTSYGYHILQYACDVESGAVELTDEIKAALHDELLTAAQQAAYDAAVTQWVSEASVETFPKVMK